MHNYNIIKPIYKSATSLIYRAKRHEDNQPVILKVLKDDYPTPAKLTHYRQEYKILHSLDLDGVIKIYDLEKYQNALFLILEDFGGDSLKQFISTDSIELLELLSLFIQITNSLGQIHAASVIHKDINPSNIVFNPDSKQLKIIDFGIATVLPRENPTLKNPNQLEGTLAYISPEQTGRMNRVMDYRTDFYALGVTFYELLTHRLPFQTKDAMELIHCHLAKQPVPPHQLNPAIPEIVSKIVMKLLAKAAEERYQSALGIKADLEKCQDQLIQKSQIQLFTLAQQDHPEKFQIPQKLYGREREIEQLLTSFKKVNQAQMMLVAGYSGIGKTALVQEIYKPLTEKRGYFISGKFDQLQRHIPYSAIVTAFADLMRQLLTESKAQLTDWKEKILAAVAPNGQVIIDVIPEVGLIMGTQPPVPTLEPKEAQNRFNLVFQNFIQVFCQPQHPLVIFLDDLQWVDYASLKLITLMMQPHHSLFLIGAYRDNEVDGAHPLMLTLEDMQKAGASMNTLTLAPLSLPSVTQLIADTLSQTPATTKPLAELVFSKTGGNPFFMREFLKTLYVEKLLHFDLGIWQWDLAQIQARNITDNIVELMANKLQKLSQKTQRLLKWAACIGNTFEINTLSLISEKTSKDTEADLWEALAEGLILPLGEAYKFAHDRIQQAVYSLIPDDKKPAMHWQIGQTWLKNTPIEQKESKIFAIIDQLNAGINQLDSWEELAQLNLLAGKKAKTSAAYQPAFDYLKIGLGLLAENSWQTHYKLSLALHEEAAEAAYLSRHVEQMESLVETVLQQAQTLLDKVKVYEIRISSSIAQNQHTQAIEIARQILKLLGVSLPKKPNNLHILLGFLQTKIIVGRKSIEVLKHMPEMSQPDKLAALRIMSSIASASYIAAPPLFPLIVFKQINLLVKHGNTDISAYVYAAYGVILSSVLGDIETGYQFGQLALALLERFETRKIKSRTLFALNAFINNWKKHPKEMLAPSLEGYQSGLETGDLEFATYLIINHSSGSFIIGRDIAEIEREIIQNNKIINQLQQESGKYLQDITQQIIMNLRQPRSNPCHFNSENYDEEKMHQFYIETNNRDAIGTLYLHKLMLCYWFQKLPQALENATLGANYLDAMIGSDPVPLFNFYESLTWLAIFPEKNKSERKRLLKQVSTNQKKLKKWAYHAPMNHQHKFYLVEAERARVLGKDKDAREYYDKAIPLAQENEYPNEEALAHELAGRFSLAKGLTQLSHFYLSNAHYAYQRWGALAKVKDLEMRYPDIFLRQSSISPPTTTILGNSFDLTSILKASQTIAGEIELSRLLEKLMKIVIENAGAEKGFLLLPQQNHWFIEAEGHNTQVTVLQSIAIEKSEQVSTNIINYVVRTGEHVVLHDATQKGHFTRDPDIIKQRPKSVLCLPLKNQGQLTGILYLENNLTTAAFTSDRVEVLNLLSSQLAISIENSLLYNELENKVAERTRELKQEIVERKRAEKTAKVANQAKSTFLANMSHDLRTPLNAILGYTQILKRDKIAIEKVGKPIDTIHRSGEHLLMMINDILDLSKIEAGKVALSLTDFHLPNFLNTLVEMSRIRAQLKGISFVYQQPSDLPLGVHGDEKQLRQILLNLLSNAIKFTEQGQVVFKIEILDIGNQSIMIRFQVEDSGIGIASERLEEIFWAFHQIGDQRIQAQGTGLGLAISQKLVRLMGSELCVESTVGQGSTFWFELDLPSLLGEPVKIEKRNRNIVGFRSNKRKILIVDDNTDNRDVLKDMLLPLGFEITEAVNGQAAIKKITEFKPDLILLDLVMPKVDGFEFLRRFRQMPIDVVVIAVSGDSFQKTKQDVLAAGCDDFIAKPVQLETLLESLQRHLKLEWIYEESSETDSPALPLILPPLTEIEALRELVETCNITGIRDYLRHLEAVDRQLLPFISKVEQLANKYQFDQLGEWIESGMSTTD